MKLSVVIPAYNEEGQIEATLRSLPDFIRTVIVVDDASSDSTPDIVARLSEHDKLCEHFHLPMQSGSTRILERMQMEYTRPATISSWAMPSWMAFLISDAMNAAH